MNEPAAASAIPGPKEAPTVPVDSGTDDATPQMIELGFGESHTWPGGEAALVSAPQEHREINPISWDITATHNGRPAQQMLTDDRFADAQISPGGTLYPDPIVPGQLGHRRTADLR